jgi:TRAP-type C4-dicarboxylate transport system permease small subunit
MAPTLRRAMDALYWLCIVLAGTALVLISAVIPWAVYTRYVMNQAASWPETFAVLLTIVLTFFGAAACYRVGAHMNVSFFVGLLPMPWQRATDLVVQMLMAVVALFMIVRGGWLAETTWSNSIDAFPWLSVGVTYLPIPLSGVILLLFIIERVAIGPPEASDPATAHSE